MQACSQEESRLLECSSDFKPELGAMRDTSKTPQVRVARSNLAADERMHHKGSPWATQDRSHQRQRQTLCASQEFHQVGNSGGGLGRLLCGTGGSCESIVTLTYNDAINSNVDLTILK